MESFAKLMSTLGVSHSEIDFVAALPVELAELILLKLDPRSLLNAARVSKKWTAVCIGSSRLRKTARHHLRKDKRRMTQDNVLARGSKSSASRITRMQTDLAQRAPRQGNPPPVSLVFGIDKRPSAPKRWINTLSGLPKPTLSTRSSPRLR